MAKAKRKKERIQEAYDNMNVRRRRDTAKLKDHLQRRDSLAEAQKKGPKWSEAVAKGVAKGALKGAASVLKYRKGDSKSKKIGK